MQPHILMRTWSVGYPEGVGMGFEPEVKSAFDQLAQRHPSSFGKNAQFDVRFSSLARAQAR
jgi:hypothetical protein